MNKPETMSNKIEVRCDIESQLMTVIYCTVFARERMHTFLHMYPIQFLLCFAVCFLTYCRSWTYQLNTSAAVTDIVIDI